MNEGALFLGALGFDAEIFEGEPALHCAERSPASQASYLKFFEGCWPDLYADNLVGRPAIGTGE